MEKNYEKSYHKHEFNNWWFISRRDVILSLLKDEKRDAKIIDIGCGGGPLLGDLKAADFTNVCGIDFSADAIEVCKQRGFSNVFQMDAHHPDFPENSFDIIIASDTLEHLQKDDVALSNWYKILKPGGKMLVFVPSFMNLWSKHDVINMHYRRYTKSSLKKVISQSGFKISKAGYWNFLLFFPTYLVRRLQPKKSDVGNNVLDSMPIFINAVLTFWVKHIENPIFKRLGLPIGMSVFTEAIKPINSSK